MPSQEREGLHAEAKKLHAEVDELRLARLDNENRLVETTSMAEEHIADPHGQRLAELSQIAQEYQSEADQLRAAEAMRLAEMCQMAKELEECRAEADLLRAAEAMRLVQMKELEEQRANTELSKERDMLCSDAEHLRLLLKASQEELSAQKEEVKQLKFKQDHVDAPELKELREERLKVQEELRKVEMLRRLHSQQPAAIRRHRLSTVSLPLAQAWEVRRRSLIRRRSRAASVPARADSPMSPQRQRGLPKQATFIEPQRPVPSSPAREEGPLVSRNSTGMLSAQSLRLCAELTPASWQASPVHHNGGVCGEHSPGSASTERTAALNPAVLRSRSHSPVRTAPARGSRSSCASSRQVLLPPSLPATSSLAAEPRFLCALPPTKVIVRCREVPLQDVSSSSSSIFALPRTRHILRPGHPNITFRAWSPVRVEPDLVAGRAWVSSSPTAEGVEESQDAAPRDLKSFLCKKEEARDARAPRARSPDCCDLLQGDCWRNGRESICR